MAGELKTQGTQLFILDNGVSPAVVRRVPKLTSVDGVGGAASDIDVTNFDSLAKEFLVGLTDNGTSSFGLNFVPTDPVHQRIFEMKGGDRFPIAIGFSDGTAAPTIGPGDVFVLPNTRSWATFSASVQEASLAFATDDAVRVNASLRISGEITVTPKA